LEAITLDEVEDHEVEGYYGGDYSIGKGDQYVQFEQNFGIYKEFILYFEEMPQNRIRVTRLQTRFQY